MYISLQRSKYPKLLLSNHKFYVARRKEDKTIWICSFYSKTKCKARLETNGKTTSLINKHNHTGTFAPDENFIPINYVPFTKKL